MIEKTRKKKKLKLKVKRSIAKQRQRMNQGHTEIKKYMIDLFKEKTPGTWETLKKSEPAWFKEFTHTFNNSSEMISKKLKVKGMKWSELTDPEKRDWVGPVLNNNVDLILQKNEYLKKIRNEKTET